MQFHFVSQKKQLENRKNIDNLIELREFEYFTETNAQIKRRAALMKGLSNPVILSCTRYLEPLEPVKPESKIT